MSAQTAGQLAGYECLVCVTGGIAAYKTCTLVSRLVQAGCGVTVAMTRSARRFVGPTSFQALSGRPVLTSLWRGGMPHLDPGATADLAIVAPATANILGKLANGIADEIVSALLIATDCPLLIAPAMNSRMWNHPAVQRNLARLREDGCVIVGPESGWQACRDVGPGRMSEPETLFEAAVQLLRRQPPRRGTAGS